MKFKVGNTVRLTGFGDSYMGLWKVEKIDGRLLFIRPIKHDGYSFIKEPNGTYKFGNSSFELVKTKKTAYLPDWL
jgi:hypothetical protein